ncbi:MAG: DUF5666 domain-containing protein [Acidobacteriota bacterium]|nr:DUF5666 domain-containing protein [Acidobacteriota bacterium]
MALLLFGALFSAGPLEPQASADGIPLNATSPVRASSIEGTVSAVTGTVLDVIGGQFRIDVANATIESGDGPSSGPLPATGIPVGARIVAQVPVGDALSTVFPPPPLPATHVVVFLPRDGQLVSTIQGVDVAGGKFTMFFHSVSTNRSTKWAGFGPNGPVKGIGDLSAGMLAIVSVVNSGGLLATSVEAFGTVTPPHLIAFRGPVQSIGATQWQVDSRVVTVNADTKIVGDPRVGDTVDVLARIQDPPPGSLAPSYLVALTIVRSPIIFPPGPGDRTTEFDGTVESIPAAATAGGAPLGHWKISSRDVLVNGLTRLDSGIAVGTAVRVKGVALMASSMGGSLSSTQFVATEIRKK